MALEIENLFRECKLPSQKGKKVLFLEHGGDFSAAMVHFERLTEEQPWTGLVNAAESEKGLKAPVPRGVKATAPDDYLWVVQATHRGGSGTVALRKFSGTPPHYPGLDLNNIAEAKKDAERIFGQEPIRKWLAIPDNRVEIKFVSMAGGYV